MFYMVVVKEILLYGPETWVLLSAMEAKVEGSHTEFLRQITEKRAWWIEDGMWEMSGAEVVQEAVVMQSLMDYIGRRQATVVQWVVLRPIFEVCAGEKDYERGWTQKGGLVT